MTDDKKQKIILVTGGAGFIGSHLIEELVRRNDARVVSLDNYFHGTTENHIDGAEYIDGHTKDIRSLVDFIPDIIYHLGEYSRTSASFEDVEMVWDLNILGTFKVLEFCRKNNVRLVYSGSSTKFGDSGEGKNQSPYAWSKSRNTDLIKQYGDWFGMDYVITYFYNVYGEREWSDRLGTLIGIFKEKYKNGEKLTIVKPGTQKRNFTYVGDIVKGLILAGEKGNGDGYALGSAESYTLLEVAEMFGGEIKMLPERPGDRKYSTLNLGKTESELGWKAKKNLRDYIDEFKNTLR